MNRKRTRSLLIREAILAMKQGSDWQSIVTAIFQSELAIECWPDNEKRESIAEGIARFAEHALGFSRT